MTNSNLSPRIGFMQGRLCDLVDGRIQAFPWDDWQKEFPVARSLGVRLMEWTLDHDRLYENPIMNEEGRTAILSLCREHGLFIPSLTGDLFMQAPFYKAKGSEREQLVSDMQNVLEACRRIQCKFICIPLVDDGRLEDRAMEDGLVAEMKNVRPFLVEHGLGIVFESDYQPGELNRFIRRLDEACFGVNLDTGNSAAFGFKCREELALYTDRILNVHIKDRLPDFGTTVPLGAGVAEIGETIRGLEEAGYTGNYILQTARAEDGDHAGAVARYGAMVQDWLG
ncbi:sugar phosphate isomerase/epimerase family protein [Salidesulfovibrio onnuriiensis]|uniref:sugar phosphate isomerase/epimerase family protein n=1 Tax=Salidesulfovibrio onnuriiensis TaxID=2583823 RepID=UPI001C9C5E21|nr:TIM barrel protein [Salidesulfovibrio onnuriiensis]